MRALVTGGSGFLGRYVVEQLLARGDTVRSLGRRPQPELAALGVETIQADISDGIAVAAACQGIDVVHHTAAVAGIWGPWQPYHTTNVVGTQNVIAGCRAHGVPRLVFTSSPSVTFRSEDQSGVNESVPYSDRWLCHYPHSKALAEQAVLAANDGQLTTCALRPHLIWGPRDEHLVPRLIDRARRGRLRRVGNGANLIDMVYVENAAAAQLQAADALAVGSPVAGRAYFISQGEPVNCWQWIDQLLGLAGLPPVRKSISFAGAWRLGRACEVVFGTIGARRDPPMTRFLAAQLAKNHYFDISAAVHDFSYTPMITTSEGMHRLGRVLQQAGQVP